MPSRWRLADEQKPARPCTQNWFLEKPIEQTKLWLVRWVHGRCLFCATESNGLDLLSFFEDMITRLPIEKTQHRLHGSLSHHMCLCRSRCCHNFSALDIGTLGTLDIKLIMILIHTDDSPLSSCKWHIPKQTSHIHVVILVVHDIHQVQIGPISPAQSRVRHYAKE